MGHAQIHDREHHKDESILADKINRRLDLEADKIDELPNQIKNQEENLGTFNSEQKKAIKSSLEKKLTVIDGREGTGKAEVIAEKAELVINNLQRFSKPENMKKFTDAADQITSFVQRAELTMARVDTMVMENRDTLNETIQTAHNVAESLDESIVGINRLVNNDTLKHILANTQAFTDGLKDVNLKVLVQDLSELVRQTQVLLNNADNDINQGTQELRRNLELLKYTLENLNEASRKINSNPSILLRRQKNGNMPDDQLEN